MLLSRRPDYDAPLRYLGLPGADLLDIRYFHGRFCEEVGRKFTFLGFDESAKPNSGAYDALNISLQEVRALRYVDQQSEVLGDDFRKLADADSIAWDRAQALGPFDVVNVDLCDGFARDEPSMDASMYSAIYQLGGVQGRHLRPWSLFLTSRIGAKHFSHEVLRILIDLVQSNVNQCVMFAESCERHFGGLTFSDSEIQDCTDVQFFNMSTSGLAKWLLKLAHGMKCRFSIPSAAAYRVWGGAPHFDMLSLVVRFEPVLYIGPDPSGLAKIPATILDECIQSAEIPGAIATALNIDKHLADDHEMREQMIDGMAELLTLARYDANEFRAWAQQQFRGKI